MTRTTTQLRTLLEENRCVVAPGVFDGMSARLVAGAGFRAAYASGGAIARSCGIPDLGLLSLAEIAGRLEQIVDAVDIPIIADADNGYGNALNAQRAARAFERAGVAAFHLEDQAFPKRCGHYEDKSVVPVAEMVGKLKAVRDRLHDPDFVVIARSDAIAVEGFDAAIDRCLAYAEAGADVLFLDAPVSEAQVESIARRLPGWKLINMFRAARRRCCRLHGSSSSAFRSSSFRATCSVPEFARCSARWRRSGATAAVRPCLPTWRGSTSARGWSRLPNTSSAAGATAVDTMSACCTNRRDTSR
jgi:2-methylisocitrate lyase-like PEP mutase family enzyme